MSRITGLINEKLKYFGFKIKKYESPNYKWLYSLKINTIIDIGANVGQFATEYSKILPNAKIYSFEPIKKCFDELERNTKKLDIECFNIGLGNETTETTINVYNHSPSSSLMKMATLHEDLYPHSIGFKAEKVVVDKLDNIFKERKVDSNILMKIDVQGYESFVIEGGMDTLKKTKVLIIEMSYYELYIGQKLFDDIFLTLYKLGFRFKGNVSQTLNQSDGSVVFSDAIFINENFDQ